MLIVDRWPADRQAINFLSSEMRQLADRLQMLFPRPEETLGAATHRLQPDDSQSGGNDLVYEATETIDAEIIVADRETLEKLRHDPNKQAKMRKMDLMDLETGKLSVNYVEPELELVPPMSVTYSDEPLFTHASQAPVGQPLPDLAFPPLDPRLARQTVSLRHFAQATQRYMIRFQSRFSNVKIEDFSAEIGINRSYYYKILNCERRPSRDTAIAMAVCMGLNADETQDYLLLLGDKLNESVKRDYLILECIRRRYSVDQTDAVLIHFDSSPLVDI